MDIKKSFNDTAKYIKKFFRGKPSRHLGKNRFLSVERQQEIIAAAQAKRARKDDIRRIIYHQQTRLGLFA